MPEKIEIAVLAQDKFSGVFSDLIGQLGNINPIAGAAASGIIAIGAALTKAAMDTVDYADEVRKMMQLTGQSAEESSRVIQVMDDYKVSTAALTMATRTLSKQGLTLNIDTLAKLSDEYIKLGSGAEKTKFLIDNFGRSGLQMAEAMQQGSAAIRDASKAVEDGLIMTQKGIDDTRNYQKAVDGLNDNFKGLEITVGTQVVPVLARLIDMTNTYLIAQEKVGWSLFGYKTVLEFVRNRIIENNAEHANATKAVNDSAAAMDGASLSADQLAESEALAAASAKAMTDINKEYLSILGSVQSSEETYQSKVASLAEDRKKIEADRAAAIAQGWWETSDKVKEYDAALLENTAQVDANAAEHDKKNKEIMLGIAERKLMQDGVLDDKEIAWLLEKGKQWGIYSDAVVAETTAMITEVNKMTASMAGVPTVRLTNEMNTAYEAARRLAGEYVVDIHTIYTSEGTPGPTGGGVIHGQATGGPGSGAYTLVGERGPELVRIPGGSHVYPNSQTDKMMKVGKSTPENNKQVENIIFDMNNTLKYLPGQIALAIRDSMLQVSR